MNMEQDLDFYKKELREKKEIFLKLKIHAGAKKTEFKEILENGIFKINISVVPEKGKANGALIKFLSKEFAVGRNQIEIISGKSDKNKLIKIYGKRD